MFLGNEVDIGYMLHIAGFLGLKLQYAADITMVGCRPDTPLSCLDPSSACPNAEGGFDPTLQQSVARVVHDTLKMSRTNDFIVVGAVSAGCVLENQLSEDNNCSVAMIEAEVDTGMN